MDPDENLREQIDIAQRIVDEGDDQDVDRFAELVLALDEWIRKGGFLPKDWSSPPTFRGFVVLARKFMENYPPDVFTGESKDPGALFVVALRKALEHLPQEYSDV